MIFQKEQNCNKYNGVQNKGYNNYCSFDNIAGCSILNTTEKRYK